MRDTSQIFDSTEAIFINETASPGGEAKKEKLIKNIIQ